eukprot:6212752-Pleurochrysis_carterae.AAC.3
MQSQGSEAHTSSGQCTRSLPSTRHASGDASLSSPAPCLTSSSALHVGHDGFDLSQLERQPRQKTWLQRVSSGASTKATQTAQHDPLEAHAVPRTTPAPSSWIPPLPAAAV